LELSNGVELLDGLVPCSIAGWRGQQLHLTAAQAQLTFRLPNSIQILEWNQLQAEHPQLRGLKLKGKQSVHLEVPAVWYPPLKLGKSVNILVEDLTNRTILTALDATVTLPANSNWQCFRLSQWITQSGSYAVRLWNQVDRTSTAAEADRWSERFEVRSGFELSQPSNMSALVVCDRSQTPLETSGQAASPEDFWLEEITLRGLWALEEIKILLTNGKETQSYRQQASPSGVLAINLAAWRDVLPESDWYALSYQRQGEDLQRLLEMGSGETVSHTWTNQALHLSGLQPGRSYSLVLWNVLAPQNSLPPQSVVSLPNQKTVTVPLVDLFGIFYVQIESSMQFAQSLGWWCGIQEIANLSLSDELSGDLFEYCMNVFENESVEIFLTEIQRLNLDFDAEAIKQAIAALENLPCHLPNWLDRDLFRQKLQVFLESPDNPEAEIGAEQQEISISPQVNSPAIVSINGHTVTPPQQGRWYLVTIRPNNNSQSIFSGELRRRDNRHLIERCEISSCHEYQQYILIKTSNFSSETLELIRQTPCFQKIERRPLSLNQVTRMLGVNPDAA